jgi:hypothetical protein
MRTASIDAGELANLGGAVSGNEKPKMGIVSPLNAAISETLKVLFPRKTWALLADLTGITERVAKHRLSNARAYTVDELQSLLQSENGFEILQTLMAGAEPKWWWWAKRVIATAERRRQAAEIEQEILLLETSRPADVGGRRRLKGDLDAKTKLGTAFARAETTLGILRPDVNRAPARAVAQAKGRR